MATYHNPSARRSATAALILLALAAQCGAEPVPLGTIERHYGAADGRDLPTAGAGGCAGTQATSVTVTADPGCRRFADAFDLSSFGIEAIDHFTLTLQFSSDGGDLQAWRIRPGSATVPGTAAENLPALDAATAGQFVQTFVFDASLDTFGSMLAGRRFVLAFASTSANLPPNFALSSATLQAWAEPALEVPEPGTLALAGMAMLGAWGAGRRRR